jgi:predicted molibdopterin-dependent oxidoreductase YjgC
MSETVAGMIQVLINGQAVVVPDGVTVAAALSIGGIIVVRRSRTGEPRGALCGMGICHECCAAIDDVPHQRTCQVPCSDGMRIRTDA